MERCRQLCLLQGPDFAGEVHEGSSTRNLRKQLPRIFYNSRRIAAMSGKTIVASLWMIV